MTAKRIGIVLLILGFAEAIYLRSLCMDAITNDFVHSLEIWYDFIVEKGFLRAFHHRFADYSPFYLHLMAIATLLPMSKLTALKLIPLTFELIAAWGIYRILRLKFTEGLQPWWGVLAFALLPTVILNGAYWAQCDVLYTSMLIWALYYLMKEKPLSAFTFLGLAFSIKIQTVFLFPFFGFLTLKDMKLAKYWLMIPVMYFVTITPSLIAGRNLQSLLLIYWELTKSWEPLSLNCPNVYQLMPFAEDYHYTFAKGGVVFTGAVCLGLVGGLLYASKGKKLSHESLLLGALTFALMVPFLLPHMHERYFFIADVLSLLYVVKHRKHFWLPIAICSVSLLSYLRYILGGHGEFIEFSHMALVMLVCLVFLVVELVRSVRTDTPVET